MTAKPLSQCAVCRLRSTLPVMEQQEVRAFVADRAIPAQVLSKSLHDVYAVYVSTATIRAVRRGLYPCCGAAS